VIDNFGEGKLMINEYQQSRIEVSEHLHECPVSVSTRSKMTVFLWKGVGVFCVGLAILGAILPILPTTVFLIMATGCFAKSSPRMQQKLLNHKVFGPLISDWQQHKSIPKKAKRIALLSMILSVAWSTYLLQDMMLSILVIALVIGPFIFLWRMPISR